MRVATGLLALGTLTTWLLAGPFAGLLAHSLPFHEMEPLSTLEVVEEVLFAPATWLAMVVIAGGAGAWMVRQRLSKAEKGGGWFDALSGASFGFEPLNRGVVFGVERAAFLLQKTQTGQMNWNILGIIGALLMVLVILWWGA